MKKNKFILLIRKYWKDVFHFVLGVLVFSIFLVGLCRVASNVMGEVNGFIHAYIYKDRDMYYTDLKKLGRCHYYYENGKNGYVRNIETREKVLEDISWITSYNDVSDSLLCFSSNGFRGYWNIRTEKVDIPANKYVKAWKFSEGIAAVMEKDSTLKFIDTKGNIVIDKHFKYDKMFAEEGYLFKNGYCAMMGSNQMCGLIDKNGAWKVAPQYDKIYKADRNFWIVCNSGKFGVLNDSLRVVFAPEYRDVLVTDHGIEVLKQDYSRQLLDFSGKIIESFIYTNISDLYYKSGVEDSSKGEYKWTLSPYKEYCTTKSSTTNDVKVGLLGPDGKPVTPPLYAKIYAVNADCFRCFFEDSENDFESEGSSVLINRKGQVIKDLK